MALCWSLDKLGPICRSADDAATVLTAIAGPDPMDRSTIQEPLKLNSHGPKPKIGLLKESFQENQADACERAYENVLDVLRKQGYETVEISIPKMPYGRATDLIVNAEGASAHENFVRSDRLFKLQDPHQVAGFMAALDTKATDYLWAMRLRSDALIANEIWDKCDCFFTPVFYHKSIPAHGTFDGQWGRMGGFEDPSNLLGWPAMAFPIGFEDGAPLGGQVIAPSLREDVCYRVVRDFQRNSDFHLKHPPV
jgi:aspartyl-tRNA(Asn)/glutamyl-tRNA(Gln) amidotransferase subunit A